MRAHAAGMKGPHLRRIGQACAEQQRVMAYDARDGVLPKHPASGEQAQQHPAGEQKKRHQQAKQHQHQQVQQRQHQQAKQHQHQQVQQQHHHQAKQHQHQQVQQRQHPPCRSSRPLAAPPPRCPPPPAAHSPAAAAASSGTPPLQRKAADWQSAEGQQLNTRWPLACCAALVHCNRGSRRWQSAEQNARWPGAPQLRFD